MISAILALSTHAYSSSDFRRWGLETIDEMSKDLLLPGANLFAEEARPGVKPSAPAFTWSVGVLIQALNSAADSDATYRPILARTIEATRSYWNPEGPVAGYDVLPMPKPKDRYYDDNEWMVLALVESSKILKSSKILDYAKDTFRYVMSGHDSALGGGIYWRESDKASKNACSNGPAAAAALALYDVTHDETYLKIAEDIYGWTKTHLRDPIDGLYWDNIALNGKIQTMKWSYNTALMLRSAAELYRATQKKEYAEDAREMQKSSLKKWVGADGSLQDDGKFMHLLLENWIRAYQVGPEADDPRHAIGTGLALLHDRMRDSLGHYGNRWDKAPANGPYSPFKLIDQASVARAFLEAAAL